MEERQLETNKPVKGKRGRYKDGKLTESQLKFAKEYAATGNAALAVTKAYPMSKNPKQQGYELKKLKKIQEYIIDSGLYCAEVQMQMIMDDKTPAAVRNDAIKYRLSAIGVGKAEEGDEGGSIGEIVIRIG